MSKKTVLFIMLLVIAAVFYYSWLPDPSFKNETYLPKWILVWSNHYYNLQTAIPFVFLGFLLESYTQQKSAQERNHKHNRKLNFIQNLEIATIVVCIAEGGQFLIKSRNPDLMDVFYGILGSFLGALGSYLVDILNNKRVRNAK